MQFPQHIAPSQVPTLPSLSWRGWPFPNTLLGLEELSSAPLFPCPSVPGVQVVLAQGPGQGLLVLGGVVGDGATWPFPSAPEIPCTLRLPAKRSLIRGTRAGPVSSWEILTEYSR